MLTVPFLVTGASHICLPIYRSDSIKVCIRVRPPNSYQENTSQTLIQDSFEGSSESVASSGCCLEVATPTSIILHSKPEPKTFTFDYVAGPHVVQVCKLNIN